MSMTLLQFSSPSLFTSLRISLKICAALFFPHGTKACISPRVRNPFVTSARRVVFNLWCPVFSWPYTSLLYFRVVEPRPRLHIVSLFRNIVFNFGSPQEIESRTVLSGLPIAAVRDGLIAAEIGSGRVPSEFL